MEDEEVEKCLKSNFSEYALNTQNEGTAIDTTIQLLEQLLQNFGCSIEEDEKLLKSENLQPFKRNCIIYRKTLKNILIENIKYLKQMELEFMDVNDEPD